MTKQSSRDLADLFGDHRAEQHRDELFELFRRPNYYPELEQPRPCFLVGGRGSGKTTVLKCLSWEGRYRLEGENPERVDGWDYFGFYQRINSNRVSAFQGGGVDEERWQRLFSHYLNLVFCGQLTRFLKWHQAIRPGLPSLDRAVCEETASLLHSTPASDVASLDSSIEQGLRTFEAYLNNIDIDNLPKLSLQGQPLDHLTAAIRRLPHFSGKHIFLIVDEFENLLDSQQRVVNTLLKHCGEDYFLKIGVRQGGRRLRSTVGASERLRSPADFAKIDIEDRLIEHGFDKFAAEVCNKRLKRWNPEAPGIEELLPGLSMDEEAALLGIREVADDIRRQHAGDEGLRKALEQLTDLEVHFANYCAEAFGEDINSVVSSVRSKVWKDRLHNHGYAAMFAIRANKAGIRKHYAGWLTYTKLAGDNIRFLLELLKEAFLLQRFNVGSASGAPVLPELQTRAAFNVGRDTLESLKGEDVKGLRLTVLVLSLGQIFATMARQPQKHRPEVNHFVLSDESTDGAVEELLDLAVLNLALIRTTANKRTDIDFKGYDYHLHPIFCAFFEFSHRRKRKMTLTGEELLALVEQPKKTVREILRRNRGGTSIDSQLHMFETYLDPRQS